jgi:hypothetical protein
MVYITAYLLIGFPSETFSPPQEGISAQRRGGLFSSIYKIPFVCLFQSTPPRKTF